VSAATARATQILLDRGLTDIDTVHVEHIITLDPNRPAREGKSAVQVHHAIAYTTHTRPDINLIHVTKAVWDGTE